MGIGSFLRDIFLPGAFPEPTETRSGDSIEDLVARLGYTGNRWQPATVRDALSVPSIARAVSLIAGTTGMLSMDAYRNGVKMAPEDRPRIMVRPDPFRKPRHFFRDTAWNMATLGEAWWWIAKRGADNEPLSVLSINPVEVLMEEDANDPRYPVITWRNRTTGRGTANLIHTDIADFRHLTFMQLPGELRGVGPLQLCGAAVSVAVASQEFAANFFADGGYASEIIKAAGSLDPTKRYADFDYTPGDTYSEADLLREAWVSGGNNVPKVIDANIESVEKHEPDVSRVQMLGARDYSNGDAARMFGMPGSLLDYGNHGSSITYQTLADEFTKWVRAGLLPYFLEEIEQEMSDLLTRSTVARFNILALERADIKTRYEVYKMGIESGVLTPELAQQQEGIVAGDVENAPVPFATPDVIPTSIAARSAESVRCDGTRILKGIMRPCNKLLAEDGPFIGTCSRCGKGYGAVA
jgi:phage portal protein BeeE